MKRILNQEKVSLRAKVKELLELLGKGIRVCFSKLYSSGHKSRLEVATGFLAMLEVVKIGRASIEQTADFGEIYVTPLEHTDSNDLERVSMTIEEDE
jgi:segregation and condensation protein A